MEKYNLNMKRKELTTCITANRLSYYLCLLLPVLLLKFGGFFCIPGLLLLLVASGFG